jgi:hypothetical protein
MFLDRLRRGARLTAAALLIALASSLAHAAPDDDACLPSGAATAYGDHDETQHRLRAGDHQESRHCAVCHWTRSLRAPAPGTAVRAGEVTPPTPLHAAPGRDHIPPVLPLLPSRAPPAILL